MINGINYTSSNNTATYTIVNASGCDSIITLNLTIKTVDTSVTIVDPVITANSPLATYKWLDCNNNYTLIPGETGQSFTATNNGSYAVEITDNTCIDTSTCYNIGSISVGILDKTDKNKISVYPNPSKGEVYIELNNSTPNFNVSIRNTLGQTVYSQKFTNSKNCILNLPNENGIYFIEVITNENKIAIAKVIKE